jgi:hypothetical protein
MERPRVSNVLAALFFLWLGATCYGCGGPVPSQNIPQPITKYSGLHVRYDLLAQLAYLQEEFERETVWCLTGDVVGGVVRVTGLAPAVVTDRQTISVRFVRCNDANVVAWYHNHPRSEWDNCASSDMDQALTAVHREFHALLISCNNGVFLYRMRGEDRDYPMGRIADPSAPLSFEVP